MAMFPQLSSPASWRAASTSAAAACLASLPWYMSEPMVTFFAAQAPAARSVTVSVATRVVRNDEVVRCDMRHPPGL